MTKYILILVTLIFIIMLHEDAKRLTLWPRRLLYCLSIIFFSITVACLYVIADMQRYECVHNDEPRHKDYYRELME
ncbi:hypothetical protein [Macrococcus equi]|uniref:hypothetical protein n=1 Tax=Macrococcus equi TaxID=3395462 RepID=UPI0039BE198D